MTTVATSTRMRIHSRRVEGPSPLAGAPLIGALPGAPDPLCWLTGGDGLVGWGEVARFTATGPQRFAELEAAWLDFAARLDTDDEVGLPGSGPVAFVSFAFADSPGASVLVVPQVTVGRRVGATWLTEAAPARSRAVSPAVSRAVSRAVDTPRVRPVRPPGRIRYSDGQLPVTRWRAAVARAVARMRSGELTKVVLAHDLLAEAEVPIDPRFLLSGLAARYPECWTFAVDGLVGATPELLLRRRGCAVASRVLAGTTWSSEGDPVARLLSSTKDRGEHRLAVESLTGPLQPFCAALDVAAAPSVLRLSNVSHLATEVNARLDPLRPASLLGLAAAVHPTAAVGGTPRPAAVRLIAELEDMDRGRYAGPVGWVDANGDGELGIALRCAAVSGRHARLFAGCGLVADSDPDSEVAEAAAKLVAVRDALEG